MSSRRLWRQFGLFCFGRLFASLSKRRQDAERQRRFRHLEEEERRFLHGWPAVATHPEDKRQQLVPDVDEISFRLPGAPARVRLRRSVCLVTGFSTR